MHGRAMLVARLCALAFAVALTTAGCGDDDYAPYSIVGAACRSDFDCAPGVSCATGGDFPDGTCALPCRGHLDCPGNTACTDVKGGLCLPRCNNTLQCRPRYECKDRKDRDSDGKSLVCIK